MMKMEVRIQVKFGSLPKVSIIIQTYVKQNLASNLNAGGVLVSKKLCDYQYQHMKYLSQRNIDLEKEVESLKVSLFF